MKPRANVKYLVVADRRTRNLITDYLPDKSNRVFAEEVPSSRPIPSTSTMLWTSSLSPACRASRW